jgi:hypothetical protein
LKITATEAMQALAFVETVIRKAEELNLKPEAVAVATASTFIVTYQEDIEVFNEAVRQMVSVIHEAIPKDNGPGEWH